MKVQLLNGLHLLVLIVMGEGQLEKMGPYYPAVKYKGDDLLGAAVMLLFGAGLAAHRFVVRGGEILASV